MKTVLGHTPHGACFSVWTSGPLGFEAPAGSPRALHIPADLEGSLRCLTCHFSSETTSSFFPVFPLFPISSFSYF